MSSLPSTNPVTGPVEGQQFACAVLAALDAGAVPDWARFHAEYLTDLRNYATRLTRKYKLAPIYNAADVVQGFLVRLVYPPQRARAMFRRSAEGTRHLLPFLLVSLCNYCQDLLDHEHSWLRRGLPDDVPTEHASREPDEDDFAALRERLAQQLKAIRSHVQGMKYRAALLLRLRLDVAPLYRLDLSPVEQLLPWTEEERVFRFVPTGPSVEELWQQLRASLESSPDPTPPGDRDLAARIPVFAGAWRKWISRGRGKLHEGLGDSYTGLFALWPEGGGA